LGHEVLVQLGIRYEPQPEGCFSLRALSAVYGTSS
jgi:hypothetical protein